MLFGYLNFSWLGYILATLAMTHVTIAAVTIYLHRHQSHRALELHPVVSHFFRFWLWMTTGMITAEWVAIHRKHHATTETADDPHSPHFYGLSTLLLEGAELYRKEAKNKETLKKYSHGTPNDFVERHLYSRFPVLGISLMLFIDIFLFGIPGVSIWAIQMVWIPFFAAGVINGIGHFWGYRNFECHDAATNIVPWGILIGGEELHNNHHTYASSAKLSVKWWEFDIGWMYIKLMSYVGLAKVKKLPPRLAMSQGKLTIDMDTVRAVVANRFQILSKYYRQVMVPVLKLEQESARDKGVFKRARRLLRRDNARLTEQAKKRLQGLLTQGKTLKIVYQHRVNLQNVWMKTASTQKELLDALQLWCKQAEASGVDVLKQFAEQMRSYVPKPATTTA